MSKDRGYGQFCPIAQAAQVLAERWTPLVIRELCTGTERFNDIHRGVPRMSSSLLARRLKELEHAGIVDRVAVDGGRGALYRLTAAGKDLAPIIETMGLWGQKWARHELTVDENLDPDLLMWDIRRAAVASGGLPKERLIVRFQFHGVPVSRRFYWLVFDGDESDLCMRDPGFEVDLYVTAHVRVLTQVWLGHVSLAAARRQEQVQLEGARPHVRSFGDWFTLGHFAHAGREAPGARERAAT